MPWQLLASTAKLVSLLFPLFLRAGFTGKPQWLWFVKIPLATSTVVLTLPDMISLLVPGIWVWKKLQIGTSHSISHFLIWKNFSLERISYSFSMLIRTHPINFNLFTHTLLTHSLPPSMCEGVYFSYLLLTPALQTHQIVLHSSSCRISARA